jgi:hypothetical protein
MPMFSLESSRVRAVLAGHAISGRRLVMARALVASCGIVTAAAAALTFGGLPAFGSGAVGSHVEARPLVESRDCHGTAQHDGEASSGRPTRSPSSPSGGATGVVQQSVAVVVPPVALLRVDESDRITAAATNTGCAPRAGDEVYLLRPDGTVVLTTSVDVTRITWRGDFRTPGDYQRQPIHD